MKKIFLLFISSLLVFTSCDKGFEDLNTDPNNASIVNPNLLLGNAFFGTANITYSAGIAGDQGSCWAEQWSKVQYNDEARYSPRPGTSNTIWLLYDRIQEFKDAEKLALAKGDDLVAGVAITMQAMVYQILTDLFGDVPFSEANLGATGNFTPKYDRQEDIYAGLIALYDDAISKLSSGNGSITPSTDRIFSGDATKWLKFAASLKFRALMRISNATNVTNPALQNIDAQLTALLPNLMTSNEDSAYMHYFEASPSANPFFETIVERNRIEYRIATTLVDLMSNSNDPRLAKYAQPTPDGNGIVGAGIGVSDLPNAQYNYNNTSQIGTDFLKPETPAYFLRYAEVEFLKAEAAQRGFISGSAAEFYANGITASFNEVDALGATAFIAANPLNANTALKQIGEQKWVALFGQGFESWIEWRRTGFPVLSGAVNPIGITSIPVRYAYPGEEQSVNAANYNDAVASQGADLLTTKVWWNK
ncbi:SusD/RagB family nutrient-binding outer membrane lipoprotein [Tenacibaculum maritimum]|uniref:SusD/RagB family nutrient-binding outer membrane lipoprotein n=1 Tax=Tenacibaculum maritimum TaxID=107401 RepID=UPI001E5C7E01|nr:SusD/RagB family nutrient-binding outer membrane lipoprotein [Tenacibaculum maritimum]MCD9585388.1 SusD/RagB family nutrient-binding outer membrane lipoprotein [Tenacibaculum maritimum]MCD9610898.1 SusD/RagB family nutrient-binding outer membrane lipoprotein [Tenacibaculum maritimum]MCD9621139.1 SusD/RagB family nutrient-binding outer membrane lipoprotein [Tenacibaculum maritimum]MCD9627342.1 SusD/RagB family nutrient-binding outer membrane lipoprotein [Tenacibaculum maritimum]MCD9629799.1 